MAVLVDQGICNFRVTTPCSPWTRVTKGSLGISPACAASMNCGRVRGAQNFGAECSSSSVAGSTMRCSSSSSGFEAMNACGIQELRCHLVIFP